MAVCTEFCARVENPRGDTLGELMSTIRLWLDRQRIDLVNFTFVTTRSGIVAFDAYFKTEKGCRSIPARIRERTRFFSFIIKPF